MKNSTLRKLPIPFIAMCGIGTFVVMSLLLGSSEKNDTEQSKNPQSIAPVSEQPGNAQLLKSDAQSVEVAQSVAQSLDADKPADEDQPLKDNQLKTELVSARSNSLVGDEKYSPENPDPSAALSEALDEDAVKEEAVEEEALEEQPSVAGLESGEIVMPDSEPLLEAPGETEAASAAAEQKTAAGGVTKQEVEPQSVPSKPLDEPVAKEPVVEEPIEEPVMEEPGGETENDSDGTAPRGAERPPMDFPVDAAPRDARPEPRADRVVAGELTPGEDANAFTSIQNPSFNELPVWFAVNGRNIQLRPGQKFVFPTTRELEIRYARGGDLGEDEVAVREGTWRFGVTRQYGWKLYRLK